VLALGFPVLLVGLQVQASPEGAMGYGWMLLRMVLALGGVSLLAYLVLRLLGRRLGASGAWSGTQGPLKVVARQPLDGRRAVFIVEAAGRCFLIGVGEGGPPASLAELDSEAVRSAARNGARPSGSFLDILGLQRSVSHPGASAPSPGSGENQQGAVGEGGSPRMER
jgi:flagellar biogenesis protein FliO